MTYTIILFVTRDPSLSFDQFKHYYENTHLPMVYNLIADVWPTKFTRRYIARISRKGFGGPANPDRPPLTLRGHMNELDCDCIAELVFGSEDKFQKFYKKIYEKDIAKILVEDENKFLEKGKTRIVVVGETCNTSPEGVFSSEVHDVKNDDIDGAASQDSPEGKAADVKEEPHIKQER